MRFLLDNDVDYGVAVVLRGYGHDVVTAWGSPESSPPRTTSSPCNASNTGRVVITHDREFTARRKRHTIGLHVRIRVEQPDGPGVIENRLDELLDALTWTEEAVVEVFRTKIRHHPPRWE